MLSRRTTGSPIFSSALAIFALATLTGPGHAAVQNRITGVVRENSRVPLARTIMPKAARATDLGAAPSSLKLEGMTMRFSMTDAQQAALTKLLLDQQNPASSLYHHWLTPQQFGAQFGLSAADLATVSSWLTARGFTITAIAKSSTFITFSGTVAQVQQAFGTSIRNLSLDGEEHIGNLTEPVLPTAIAGVVSHITGLDDFKLKARARKVALNSLNTDVARPRDSITVTQNGTTQLAHFISPGDFSTIYNLNPLLSSGVTGTGVTIAVMGQVDVSLADIAAFRTASGLSVNAPVVKTYGTDPGTPTGTCLGSSPPSTCSVTGSDLDESELDIEWAGATAPQANIIFVNSTDVIGISLVSAIDDDLAPIITLSYGGCEVQDFSAASITSLNNAFQQANSEGITIVGPSGDAGATDCDNGVASATKGLAVDFPASSPNVTGVGGTEFSEGADAATPNGTYWNNTTTTASSALSYIPEGVWNDTAANIASNPAKAVLSAGGGGASAVFTKPAWQTGAGVPADGHRDVPDVSFSASVDHDAYLVCAQGSCQNGQYFTSGTGAFNAFGGTSVSAPSFAGILALLEQQLGGARIGNANPYIYALANGASYASVFHDVTTGNNASPCTVGTTGCASSPIGFSAGVGYDLASGWGSIDANQFVTKFASVATALPNTTTIAIAPAGSTQPLNQPVTLTATIAHTTGTVAPTGTVSFAIDNGAATSEPLNGSTATYAPTFTADGIHTIYAVYSGDANYYGSSTTTQLISGTIPTGNIALSASPAAITVASAGNISSQITVTSSNGYAGTVNLTAVAPSLNGTYGFTSNGTVITSLTLTAGQSATATFTVNTVTPVIKGAGSLKRSSGTSSLILGSGATLAGLLLFGLCGRRHSHWGTLFSLFALAGLLAGAGCSSSSTVIPTPTPPPASKGPYTITITGTDSLTNVITASTALTVTIQ